LLVRKSIKIKYGGIAAEQELVSWEIFSFQTRGFLSKAGCRFVLFNYYLPLTSNWPPMVVRRLILPGTTEWVLKLVLYSNWLQLETQIFRFLHKPLMEQINSDDYCFKTI